MNVHENKPLVRYNTGEVYYNNGDVTVLTINHGRLSARDTSDNGLRFDNESAVNGMIDVRSRKVQV